MVRELNMDTQRQNFWKESINKEAIIRLEWYDKFSKEGGNSLSPKPLQAVASLSLPPIALEPTMKTFHKGKKQPKNDFKILRAPGTERDLNALLVEMRPAPRKTRALLYKGFSALGEGRYAYLQARKQEKPEDKYQYPITSGWEYGWKITDAMKSSSTKPAEFGRTRIVKDSFYRTNGVFPREELNVAVRSF